MAKAELTNRAACHTFWHSFAHTCLKVVWTFELSMLGHRDVMTKMIYFHVVFRGLAGGVWFTNC